MIVIAGDHGAVELKEKIVDHLKSHGEEVVDLGTNTFDSVDYSDYAVAAGEYAVAHDCKGIVICKSGIGMSIAANKVKGVRCALCTSVEQGALCRKHNNANMLALGAAMTNESVALGIVDAFMSTEFEGGRHTVRVNKITEYENKKV